MAGQFSVGGGNNNFINKQNALFQQLNEVERTMNRRRELEQIDLICDTPEELQNKNISTKKFRGKESIFKRPEAPKPRRLQSYNRPDFLKNPHKWTKYSLEDVSFNDMSESSNASAALAFLKEMEDRRDKDLIKDISNDTQTAPKYNSSVKVKLDTSSENNDSKTVLRNLKVIMPEYVVGQSIKRKSNTRKHSTELSNKKELKLTHLTEEFEDDN
uniref:U5 small nuclear ribonucleoprotein TSSC4 n=1 Tax=Xenopsylla cheopis TaxID=163159 RepID=A0A6M2DGE8_XENCH